MSFIFNLNLILQGGISNPQSEVPFDIDMVFSAARCSWPPLELQSASDDRLITALVEYLQVVLYSSCIL